MWQPEELSRGYNHPARCNGFHEEVVYDVDQALEAIENGTYGKCTECGEDIPYERLEVMSIALQCVEIKP